MSILKSIFETYPDFEFTRATGYDEAVIGVDSKMRLIYSVKKVLEILEKDMSEDDAREMFDFNIECAYVGEYTPIWCEDSDLE